MGKHTFTLLLADDDIDDCDLFKEALNELDEPTSISIINDGEQLMQLLNSDSTVLPDILLLDLNMPRKNGLECLDEIKTNELKKNIPVVIYSTTLDPYTSKKIQQKGAMHFIKKPAEFGLLKKLIQSLIFSVTHHTPFNNEVVEHFVLMP